MVFMLERTMITSPHVLPLLIGLIFISVLLKAIQLYWRKRELLNAFKVFPGPPSHWLHGHNKEVRKVALGQGKGGKFK